MVESVTTFTQMRYPFNFDSYLNRFKQRGQNVQKSHAPFVGFQKSNDLEKLNRIDNDSGVKTAGALSSGNALPLKSIKSKAGFVFGSRRAIPFASFLISPATASLNSSKSKTIGLKNPHRKALNMLTTLTFFLMGPIFTSRAVS